MLSNTKTTKSKQLTPFEESFESDPNMGNFPTRLQEKKSPKWAIFLPLVSLWYGLCWYTIPQDSLSKWLQGLALIFTPSSAGKWMEHFQPVAWIALALFGSLCLAGVLMQLSRDEVVVEFAGWVVRSGLFFVILMVFQLFFLGQTTKQHTFAEVIFFSGAGGSVFGGLYTLLVDWEDTESSSVVVAMTFAVVGMMLFAGFVGWLVMDVGWEWMEIFIGIRGMVVGGVMGAGLGFGLSSLFGELFDAFFKRLLIAGVTASALHISLLAVHHLGFL
ncbi:MAG: hypothetical protein CL920_27685 [Deltaproteobacteria bacterium]|nr:hypothetical protein [Deltaproteobacteria bacterium]MBU52494.1 hypothetical protein [Deltaproteobacteria bacterium]